MAYNNPFELNLFVGEVSPVFNIQIQFDSPASAPFFLSNDEPKPFYELINVGFDDLGVGAVIYYQFEALEVGYALFKGRALADDGVIDPLTNVFTQINVFQKHTHQCGEFALLFLNKYGAWENLSFSGKNEFVSGTLNSEQLIFKNRSITTFLQKVENKARLFSDLVVLNECQVESLFQSPKIYLLEPKKNYLEARERVQEWQFERTYDKPYVCTEVYLNPDTVVYKKSGQNRINLEVELSLPNQTVQRL